MKVSDTLDVFLGIEEARKAIDYVAGIVSSDMLRILADDSGKGETVIGLGSDPEGGDDVILILVTANHYTSMFIGNDPIEILDYIKGIKEYGLIVAANIGTVVMRAIHGAEKKYSFKKSTHSQKEYPDDLVQRYGTEGRTMPKPTNDSRELTTITGASNCLMELAGYIPERRAFTAITKRLLTDDTSLVVVAIGPSPKNNALDSKYMCVARIGEPTNDPLDSNLIGMIAYQPEVLRNGIMYNPDISEYIKDSFEVEYNKQFNQ